MNQQSNIECQNVNDCGKQTLVLHCADASRVATIISDTSSSQDQHLHLHIACSQTHTVDVRRICCQSDAVEPLSLFLRAAPINWVHAVLPLTSPTLHFCQTVSDSRGMKVFISGPLTLHFLILHTLQTARSQGGQV